NYDASANTDDGSCVYPSTSTTTVTACDSYAWNGQTYTSSSQYTWLGVNSNGCDSTAVLNLTINQSDTSYTNITACDSLVWNGTTYTQSGIYSYSGASSPLVGTFYEGGYVFYIDSLTGLGLIATDNYIGTAEWGCYGTAVNGADGQVIGSGYQNTLDIVNSGCSSTNGSPTAASIAYNYNNGYSDWYLPSLDELSLVYQNLQSSGVLNYNTGDPNNWYWSSTECQVNQSGNAGDILFTNGNIAYCNNKNSWQGGVIAIRSFQIPILNTINGCDSTAILNLTINQSDTSYTNITACDSYDWNDSTYTQSGIYSANVGSNNNYSISFDGASVTGGNDYLLINNLPTNGNVRTYEFYLYAEPHVPHNNEQGTIYRYSPNGTNSNWGEIINFDGDNDFNIRVGFNGASNGYCYWDGDGEYTYNTWHHIVVEYQTNGSILLYVNGNINNLIGGVQNCNTLYPFWSNLEIGLFNGLLDHFSVFETSLNQQEIQQYMNCSPTGNESGLVGLWNFEDNSNPNIVLDQTQNGNHGTINGATYDTNVPSQSCNLTNANGCDSTAILNLTINQGDTSYTNITACDSVFWNGNTYSQSGSYSYSGGSNNNYSLSFDGINNFVEISNNNTLDPGQNNFTVSAWVKFNELGTDVAIYDHMDGNIQGNTARLNFRKNDFDQLHLSIKDNNANNGIGYYTAHSINTITDLNWHHVSVTFDYNNMVSYFYLDGQLINNIVTETPLLLDVNPTGIIQIGKYGFGTFTNAIIDDVHIWHKLLTN
ncbi:hypothetical protein N9B89_04735, partial [Flavobacteriales bacterium]|nr:hypothetical protein [Flavobacteriales bacterium]